MKNAIIIEEVVNGWVVRPNNHECNIATPKRSETYVFSEMEKLQAALPSFFDNENSI